MTFKERIEIYEQLEKQNGKSHQLTVAIEELAELIKEVTKALRTDSYASKKNLCEELADVKVCIEQIERFYNIDQKVLDTIIEYKLKRLQLFYLKKKD